MISLEMCTAMASHFLSPSPNFWSISFTPSLSPRTPGVFSPYPPPPPPLSLHEHLVYLPHPLSLHKLIYTGIYCALQRYCTDYEEGCGYYISANLLLLGKGSSLVCYIISNGLCDYYSNTTSQLRTTSNRPSATHSCILASLHQQPFTKHFNTWTRSMPIHTTFLCISSAFHGNPPP